MRNIPPKATPPVTETRASLQLPEDKTIVILQGNGLNEGRGGEELVEAMPFVDEKAVLLIVGNGTMIPQLKERVKELKMEERVRFVPRVTPEKLFNFTYLADIGIALDRDLSPNLRFSLPNKLFEYIKAGIPMVVSNLIERARIVGQYQVGLIVEDFQPENIAKKINKLVNDKQLYEEMKANCQVAAEELCWENEEKVLEEIYLRDRVEGEFRFAQGEWTSSKGESCTSCSRGVLIPLLKEPTKEREQRQSLLWLCRARRRRSQSLQRVAEGRGSDFEF